MEGRLLVRLGKSTSKHSLSEYSSNSVREKSHTPVIIFATFGVDELKYLQSIFQKDLVKCLSLNFTNNLSIEYCLYSMAS